MVGYGQGRGRGGPNVTGVEQLGFGVGENMPTPVLQPPATYPPLETRPIPLRTGPEEDYLVELRTDFIESLRDSPAYLLPQVIRSDIERYSDRYQTACPKVKNGLVTLNPSYLPAELRPASDRKSKKSGTIKKEVDINSRLEELEKKEGQHSDDEEEKEGNEKEVEEKEADDRDEEELEDIEDIDEEMDDGTDYVNNYFDNGESYLDEEDDNLDDGPVY